MNGAPAPEALAPIALFVYNRVDHTRRTVEALRRNPEASASELVVFCDGAKDEKSRATVADVRAFVRTIVGFKSVKVVEREQNLGLARSIIGGVTDTLKDAETVIVLEDDLVTSPFFLKYMNEALRLYRDDDRVASIHGYVYPITAPLPETFFLRGADCWGWATWRRGWALFRSDGAQLLRELDERGLARSFDLDGAYGNRRMLENQVRGKNNSWAIRWHASAYLANKLTLYPGRSLVVNIGTDDSGTHFQTGTNVFLGALTDRPIRVARTELSESQQARLLFKTYFRQIRWRLVKDRAIGILASALRRIRRSDS